MTNAPLPRHYAARLSRIDVRFAAADRVRVLHAADAAGLRPSQFVRAAALDTAAQLSHRSDRPPSTAVARLVDTDRALILATQLDVRRVGVNLNQLTRLAHHGQLDLDQLAPVIDDLVAAVADLAQKLGAHR